MIISKQISQSKKNIAKLPSSPGVYIFRKGGAFLYIGKAANLRERVKQHKTLLKQIKQLSYIRTGSEIEALILEAKLIKKYQPKYNVLWRDGKNYFYVAITREKLPRVFTTHQVSSFEFVGPFVDGRSLKQTLKYLRKIFPYYSAKKHPKTRCPWCHLNLCPGPNPDKREYGKNIKNLIQVLRGEKKYVLGNLKRAMAQASQKQDFEKAARVRDQIISLEKVLSHARVIQDEIIPQTSLRYKRIEAYDISNIQGKFATGAMVVFTGGKPDKNGYRKFKILWKKTPDDTAMLKEVLTRRFKHNEWPLPDLILVDGGKAQLNVARKAVSKVPIIALAKGRKEVFSTTLKKPVPLQKIPAEMRNLILWLDDEAHRFAISYHRKLRDIDLKKGL